MGKPNEQIQSLEKTLKEIDTNIQHWTRQRDAIRMILAEARRMEEDSVGAPAKKKSKKELKGKAYQLKITLNNVKPPVWRRVIVPAWMTFEELHRTIIFTMGWKGYHLYDFQFHQLNVCLQRPSEFDDDFQWKDIQPSEQCQLVDYLETENRCTYTYDFGDDWEHSIVVEDRISDFKGKMPEVLKLKGECPPEDSGGPWGYAEMLRRLSDPTDSEYELLVEWYEEMKAESYTIEELNEDMGIVFDKGFWYGE